MNVRVPVRVTGRAERAWGSVAESAAAAVLVVDPLDIRWLTGFTGSAGVVVLGPRAVLVVDGRYRDQAAEQVSASGCAAEVLVAEIGSTVDDEAVRLVDGAVGFDPAVTTVARTARWRAAGAPALVEVGGFAAMRMVKEPDEIARIERAAAIADRALAGTEVRPGATEEDVRNRLEESMRREGADGPGYGTIVASGPNSALPHHRPTARDIRLGDAVAAPVDLLAVRADQVDDVEQRECLLARDGAGGVGEVAEHFRIGLVRLRRKGEVDDGSHGVTMPRW